MKVSLLCTTKLGSKQIYRYRKRIEGDMACPECGYDNDTAKTEKYPDATAFRFVKVYPPMDYKEMRLIDIEYRCVKCEAEWIIQIEEPK